jgi:hypothetical protein
VHRRVLGLQPFDGHAVQQPPGGQIGDLEAEQVVHVREQQRLPAVDREGAHRPAERADLPDHAVRLRVDDAEAVGAQAAEIDRAAVEGEDGVVRA